MFNETNLRELTVTKKVAGEQFIRMHCVENVSSLLLLLLKNIAGHRKYIRGTINHTKMARKPKIVTLLRLIEALDAS